MALVRPTDQWTAKPRSPQLNSTPQHHRPRTRTTGDTAPKTTHARHRKPTTQQNQPPINSTHERSRLDAGPYTFMAADALVLKVREGGRVVNVHALIAVGVNAEGYREILGIDVTTAEDGAGWLTFLRSLTARGLSGVKLVTSDAHAGLVNAIGATLPGAAWQRCRTHYPTNLMAVTPKSSWPLHQRIKKRKSFVICHS